MYIRSEEMEPGRKAKAPEQAGEWDPAVEAAVEAAVMAQARAETVLSRSVAKGFLINWERPVLSKSAQNAGLL